MGVEKLRILGNDYIGAWVTATDRFFLMGYEVSSGEERAIKKALGVDGIRMSAGGYGFVGIYVAANSNGVLLPRGAEEREISALRQQIPDVNVELFASDYNALKNNILANDKIALINPAYGKDEEKHIGDVLDVETLRLAPGNFNTVGANNIMTNKGLVLNNRASDQEKGRVEKLVGLQSELSTANLGSVSVGLCVIANSNGLVVGDATTGYELARIAEALGF